MKSATKPKTEVTPMNKPSKARVAATTRADIKNNRTFNYNFAFPQRREFARVSKKSKCQICGKPDWCTYTKDGELAVCMRVSAGSVKTARDGGYIHVLNPQTFNRTSAVSAPAYSERGNCGKDKPAVKRADTDRLHEIYTFLLDECLFLTQNHGDHLLYERGLSDHTITVNLYASVPPKFDSAKKTGNIGNVLEDEGRKLELTAVSETLREEFGDRLRGVPGFYKDENDLWHLRQMPSGFFVPYRDIKGRIVGLQIRQEGNVENKYIWLSTNPETDPKFKEGTSSGAPIHYAHFWGCGADTSIIITEGALKADRIFEFSGETCVAIAGITAVNFQNLADELKTNLPELREVIIAYDADWRENDNVRRAIVRLERTLRKNGFQTQVAKWDISKGKGLDDVLANEEGAIENE